MADFVPHIAIHRIYLSQLLKKNAPPQDKNHTSTTQFLKKCSTKLHPLQIPSSSPRILQTDVSQTQWGAVLYEEIKGTKYPCDYKSGTFSNAEQTYHSPFKV